MVVDREERRLQALHRLGLLDIPPSAQLDRVTRMAAQIFSLPTAAVSLVDHDRQWFKSGIGLDHASMPREKAPCSQVAESTRSLVIPDLLEDEYYRDSNLARSGVRFYAGACLTTRDGFGLGSLCVLGLEPRQVSEGEMALLSGLALILMDQIETLHTFKRIEPLTGLPNRLQFLEDIARLSRAASEDEIRHLVLVDIANLKQIYDAAQVMGSSFIEEIINQAAQAITSGIGASGTTYHTAQTIFVFLAPEGITENEYVAGLTHKLKSIQFSPLHKFTAVPVIGIAPFILKQMNPKNVLRAAFSAAQDARSSNMQVGVYSNVEDAVKQRRFTILNDFEEALTEVGQLRLMYQPRIDIALGRCIGVEALLRWRHPVLGEISPSEFIPIVEQTTLARATTAWVLEEAFMQLTAWQAQGIRIALSVNLSASNLVEPDFASRLSEMLRRHGQFPESLELEITESAVMGNPDRTLATLEAIASMGVQLAIDDFGTGYSSLSYLQRLPVHVVKIDQSFIFGLADDERKRSLVTAMISLSHNLGYRVVAEGVETEAVFDVVRKSSCDEAQGYLFSRPLEPDHLSNYLAKGSTFPARSGEQMHVFPSRETLALQAPRKPGVVHRKVGSRSPVNSSPPQGSRT